jgi:Tfp pilus assembly protein PilF
MDNQRNIGIVIGAVLVLGLGIYFYQQTTEKHDQEGKAALYKVEKTFEEEQASVPVADRAPGAPLDVDTKFTKTVSELNGLLSAKTVSKRTLFEANVKLGTLYLDHGQAEKGAAVLKNGVQFAKSDFQKGSQLYLIGVAEERANQFKDALAAYQDGLTENVDALKGDMLLGMVRMSLKLGDKEKAKLYEEKMNKEVPGSKSAEIASSLIKGGI